MTYAALAALASDPDFLARVAACAIEQQIQGTGDLAGMDPYAWADRYRWEVAAAPGFAVSYQYALDTGVERPGNDAGVITDAQILAVVQPLVTPPEGP